jgi:hypothetical protein
VRLQPLPRYQLQLRLPEDRCTVRLRVRPGVPLRQRVRLRRTQGIANGERGSIRAAAPRF